jgi:hypothetical protein
MTERGAGSTEAIRIGSELSSAEASGDAVNAKASKPHAKSA